MATKSRSTPPNRPPLRVVAPPSRPKPPDHLSPAMQRWWTTVLAEFDLDAHHLMLLQACAESWDRMTAARAAIAQHGLTYTDDRGAPKARPEVAIERDARIAVARILRELDLDFEGAVPGQRGRPPALPSNRG